VYRVYKVELLGCLIWNGQWLVGYFTHTGGKKTVGNGWDTYWKKNLVPGGGQGPVGCFGGGFNKIFFFDPRTWGNASQI